jgi:hypothetical protein
VAGVFLLALLAFIFIADEMVLENENILDKVISQKLASFITPSLTELMVVITFFGSSYFLMPAYLLLIFYFLAFKKNRKLSLDVAAVGFTSTIILFP